MVIAIPVVVHAHQVVVYHVLQAVVALVAIEDDK
jgi:hypothetical protein